MRFSLVIIFFFFLISCAPIQESSYIYKHDIQQGNEIDTQQLLQLKPEMTKAQVRFILGTPLIQDSFHKNRWDYIFVLIKNGKRIERRHIILNFEEDSLKNITGEVIPDKSSEKSLEETNKIIKIDGSDNKPEESWIDDIKFWKENEEEKDLMNNELEQPIEPKKQVLPEEKDLIQKKQIEESKQEVKDDEKSWLDNLKFWESEKVNKKTNDKSEELKNEIKKAPIQEIDQNNSKDYVDEILEIDSSESLNENIKEDIIEDESKMIEIPLDDSQNMVSEEDVNRDIIEENKESEDEDYFDQLLEKIGF